MMKITDTHIYFWGSCFSNFYEAKTTVEIPKLVGLGLKIEGQNRVIILPETFEPLTFPTSEHAFMAFKAVAFNDAESYLAILGANHPAEAKAIGRNVIGFDDKIWAQIRYDRMYQCVYAKFSQNHDLKKILLETGTKTIVEASPYDKVWGVGLGENDPLILDEKNWKGQNLLGKVLMDVRQNFWDCEESEEWFEHYKNKIS